MFEKLWQIHNNLAGSSILLRQKMYNKALVNVVSHPESQQVQNSKAKTWHAHSYISLQNDSGQSWRSLDLLPNDRALSLDTIGPARLTVLQYLAASSLGLQHLTCQRLVFFVVLKAFSQRKKSFIFFKIFSVGVI